ncbi:MAG: hypothetical protein OIN86_13000 [Candidatus Methanoperedens sp.]|nr:hypothetical protein [Candidatus Methanoperedens sp.]CAG0948769.1 hypothetical protein METP1_00055 [Methanosarcinales archaeon]
MNVEEENFRKSRLDKAERITFNEWVAMRKSKAYSRHAKMAMEN